MCDIFIFTNIHPGPRVGGAGGEIPTSRQPDTDSRRGQDALSGLMRSEMNGLAGPAVLDGTRRPHHPPSHKRCEIFWKRKAKTRLSESALRNKHRRSRPADLVNPKRRWLALALVTMMATPIGESFLQATQTIAPNHPHTIDTG